MVLVSWLIWKERNRRIFYHRSRNLQEMMSVVEDEVVSWFRAGFRQLERLLVTFGRATDTV